jgi:hypothetical protein
MDNLTTGAVIVVVQDLQHPAECTAMVELSVDAPKPITMVQGTKMTFSIQHVDGVTFTGVYADIVDTARQATYLKWVHLPDGRSLSSHLPDGNYLVRMAAITAKGEIYFSSPFSFSLPGESSAIKEFQVTKGTEQSGMLDSSVPRPIKGGWIVAYVTSSTPDPSNRPSLTNQWGTFADVAKDGSFTLNNLPSGTLEIVAGCDGYVSKDKSGKGSTGVLRAQVFAMDNSHPITVDMESTGDARILVKTPDGKPLTGATVYFNPNQMTGGGTSIVGYRYRSEEFLQRAADSVDSIVNFRPPVPDFSAKTDADGVAVIKGLPPGRQGYHVYSDSFDMPISAEMRSSPRRSGMIIIKGATETSDVVEMEAKGTTSLSAAIQAAKGW